MNKKIVQYLDKWCYDFMGNKVVKPGYCGTCFNELKSELNKLINKYYEKKGTSKKRTTKTL